MLEGMTWERWQTMPHEAREAARDNSDLTAQLVGLEGWRVEVLDAYGERRRFIVGKSTGWRPCHIELKLRTSMGGIGVTGAPFKELRRLYKAR